ncbi:MULTISPECIES: thioredoxin family protein [Polaromonas]|uniref:Thioredoxin family protein n=1 Tax=Polaromonas aquatica TaxID=332657 RepID=A0ABW1TUI0_9BURK
MTDFTSLQTPTSWVICLCADWCGLCHDYRRVLEAIAVRHPGLRFAWLDIEDQADLVGDLDIETFPTLLVADEEGVHFLGPLTPHAETLSRLLTSLQEPGTQRTRHEPVTHRLLQVLPALPGLWLMP